MVAVLLAVAILISLAVGLSRLTVRPVPVVPPPPPQNRPIGLNCPDWGPRNGSQSSPVPSKMTDAQTGWAAGDLRTTDGGHTWHDVSPAAFRHDAPAYPAGLVYPGGYTEFFLDGDHAWIARPYTSAKSCFDHIDVFATNDGGRSWVAGSIPVALDGDTQLQMQLDFLNAQQGWLIVRGNGGSLRDDFLYGTQDAGRSWQLISRLPSGGIPCPIQFSSPTVGWTDACGDFQSAGPTFQMTVTRDGGRSWSAQQLPLPPGGCPCSEPIDLSFVNPSTAAFLVDGYTGVFLYLTSDGGSSWHVDKAFPGSSLQAAALDFEDIRHLWATVYDPTDPFGKGAPIVLYQSSDLGAHWHVVQKGVPLVIPDVSLQFVDPLHGFAVQPSRSGQGSQLLTTGDGGHTWIAVQGHES
ncbi:MAG TPA: hypothetical protein VJT08_17320 [Terriglobales bacterium]|nr:hypothetical protein [Terriglobales bacterium]